MKEFILIRHGETDFNRDKRFVGSSDIPLNDTGKSQARSLKKKFRESAVDSVYCSTMKRCRETAAILYPGKINFMDDLREMNFGIFEGLTFEEIKAEYSKEWDKWKKDMAGYRIPGGECYREVADRVLACFEKIKEMTDGTAVIVSHSGCIRTILSYYLTGDVKNSWRFFVDNCTISKFSFDRDYAYLKSLNER